MKKLKDNSGITLVTLVITIVVMMILAMGVTMSTTSTIELKKYNEIKQDIITLSEAVKTYYLENEKLPIYTDTTFDLADKYKVPDYDINPNDSGNYYAIDVSKLPKTSLNKGEGNKSKNFSTKDLYVVNEESLTVYYLDGAVLDGKKHYTIVDNFAGGSFAEAYYSKVDLPIISVVTMESNNKKDKTIAEEGNIVTLKMLTNYNFTQEPTVIIDGIDVTSQCTWNRKVGTVEYRVTELESERTGQPVEFEISNYMADGRIENPVTEVTFGQRVYFGNEKFYLVDETYYAEDIAEAEELSKNGSTIKILKDVKESSGATITKDIILDTNKKVMTLELPINVENGISMTINGEGKIERQEQDKITSCIINRGTLNIADVEIRTDGEELVNITNYGNLFVNSGTIINNLENNLDDEIGKSIGNHGNIVIEGGTIGKIINYGGKMNINAGDIHQIIARNADGTENNTNSENIVDINITMNGGKTNSIKVYNYTTLTIGNIDNAVNKTTPDIAKLEFPLKNETPSPDWTRINVNFYNGIIKDVDIDLSQSPFKLNIRQGYNLIKNGTTYTLI